MSEVEYRISIHVEYREVGAGVSEATVELEGPAATTENMATALRHLLSAKGSEG